MGLETATYISDLVATNPVVGDGVGQGDDHLRLLKAVLLATFPDANTAINLLPLVQAATPVGAVMDYAGLSAPSGWLFAYGQAVSRSTYSALFSVIGTTYGVGNGTTTFTLPDLRGRVVAGKDDMGGSSADRLTNLSGGVNGDTLGGTGGAESHVITQAQLPNVSLTAASNGDHAHTFSLDRDSVDSDGSGSQGLVDDMATSGLEVTRTSSTAGAHTHTVPLGGSGTAHNNVQPTIILNKIIYTGVA